MRFLIQGVSKNKIRMDPRGKIPVRCTASYYVWWLLLGGGGGNVMRLGIDLKVEKVTIRKDNTSLTLRYYAGFPVKGKVQRKSCHKRQYPGRYSNLDLINECRYRKLLSAL
jgi:hypothetical protein